MTNKLYSAILAGTAVLAVTLGASSANAATATGHANATIVEQLSVTEDTQMNFGVLAPTNTAGTVALTTAGVRTCNANVTCINGIGTVAAGAFHASGAVGANITLSVDTSTTLNNTSGTGSMTLNGISLSAASGTGVLNASGRFDFTVGGTLNVGANQNSGVYTGTYNVTANYS
jgi:Mat/Ecp fimbriae major subunit